MEDDDWSQLVAGIGTERLDEVLDVLDHAADDDVVDGEHVVFQGGEDYVVLLDLLLLVLHYQEVAVDVLDIDVGILVIIQFVEIGSNDCLFHLIKALKIIIAILIADLVLVLFKDTLSLRKLPSNNVSIVIVLIAPREGFRQFIVARIQQDVSTLSFINNNFKCKEKQAMILVHVVGDVTEAFVGVRFRDGSSVDFEAHAIPVIV